ncbi:MAG: hypothetical protein Kow0062_05110 [Acidobacteriota bacterium]
MPIYEFRCEECGHVFEALRRVGQGPEGLVCPQCGGTRLEQVWSTFAAGGGSESGAGSAGSCPPGGG